MNKAFRFIGRAMLFAVLGLMALIAGLVWWFWISAYDWNQKVVVTVETPTGIVSGASVQHIEWRGGTSWGRPNGGNASSETRGEAVVVDLGDGRVLFALLQGDGASRRGQASTIAQFALCPSQEMAPGAECFSRLQGARAGTSAELNPNNYPMLVTFTDVNDPTTVKLVDPANPAATFGQGFVLKAISVEITNEKVTEGAVGRVLGWIDNYYDTHLDGNKLESADAANRLANSLSAGSFDTVKTK